MKRGKRGGRNEKQGSASILSSHIPNFNKKKTSYGREMRTMRKIDSAFRRSLRALAFLSQQYPGREPLNFSVSLMKEDLSITWGRRLHGFSRGPSFVYQKKVRNERKKGTNFNRWLASGRMTRKPRQADSSHRGEWRRGEGSGGGPGKSCLTRALSGKHQKRGDRPCEEGKRKKPGKRGFFFFSLVK